MKGYYNNPERDGQDHRQADGWLHTGDIAKMDADGYFYIVDRKKDLIIASGYNIVPREVEEVLFMHPKVMEATVIGVPDAGAARWSRPLSCSRKAQLPPSKRFATSAKRKLAPYKVPTFVEFRKELPKTQVGKVLRRMLLEEEKAKIAAQGPEKE
jgi:long-chain acyl-CoA synthetase